ncbi:tRNA-specific 2-thiouridylase MnmA [Phycisphaerae bacterium RAS1]|nr:tRNA-specific 2-thiouridylase MnmA [Phycisphaerae bacterium RAS1]
MIRLSRCAWPGERGAAAGVRRPKAAYNRGMSRNGRIIVAMSGGVDSSVAACLLKEQGYECIGVFLRVGAAPAAATDESGTQSCEVPAAADAGAAPRPRLRHGCCSATDAIDARAVAGRLGIRFYALNFEADFERIIDYFVDEYAAARTPNPCVMCNVHLKFGKLLRYADAMDAEFIATGHYARIRRDAAGNATLARARNLAKDQSYVLFGVQRSALPRCVFPLGEFEDKRHVRALAAGLGLRVHDKPDSQEICFVPDNDYKELLRRRRPEALRAGDIRDTSGRVVGRHEGVANFTIGQRRSLGIALGRPVYVTSLNVVSNTVTIGERDDLLAGGLVAQRVNWLTDPPARGCDVATDIKIRHMHTPAAGRIRRRDDEAVEVRFDEPQSAVTPGQAAVFYQGEDCLGGGWIQEAR